VTDAAAHPVRELGGDGILRHPYGAVSATSRTALLVLVKHAR
jgi:hypothetical protein